MYISTKEELPRSSPRRPDAIALCIPCSVILPVSVAGCVQVGPKYKLEKYLGSGSFSSVCLALDTETGLKVRADADSDSLSQGSSHPTLPLSVHCLYR